ncbi:hypothetical protein LRP88_05535 [Fusarium phalaenopsidis]
MKFINAILFTLTAAVANACEETMCADATLQIEIECPECITGPCHLYSCPESIFSYICGEDKTKCELIS